MMALLSADQNLLAPNLTAAANDFGLDSHQKDTYLGGYVMAAFFMIGAPSAIICGWLTDKVNRVHLLFAIIIIGQGPCLCTYFVTTFWQFLVLRMLTGVAVGGVFPLVFSLLGDLFPATQRAAMASLLQIATGLGIGAGQFIAGIVGPATNWRIPFVLVAAPALLLALIMVATTREPPRGAFEEALRHQYAEGHAYEETISWAKAKQALRSPSNWVLITQAIPGCLPWGMMQTYFNDYLSQEKGFTVQVATLVLLLFGLGGGVGIIAGGAAGQLLYNWRKEAMPVMAGACIMLGVAPVYYLINVDLQAAGVPATLAMAALAGAVVSVAAPNLRAAMLNVNEPETRGVALALQSVTDDLGRGLGPIIVAAFIETLGGRRNAFNLAVAGWLPCGVIIFGLSFCMRKDEAAVQDRLRRHSHAAAVERRRTGSCGLGDDVLIEGPPSPVVVAARAGDGERSSSGSMGSGVDGARLHEPGGTVFAHVHQRQPSPRPGRWRPY
ncbi:major facilitator superfamily MFS-1 [Monoraphidium neglectum]|uniref:Major facilitator superfamily MFS-1 n=1 Tax=Monoraphidium neglectum TaxID=145388 RepID=A0A0D2LBS4_9CHLO|nr:major facilitator superfamily MFS-1 [Monoraphidium neglectum]KIZ04154.1 major facilitator superfamily MFS-1 [Monoraphidium neglectum]|eukprot:XP_013903173.1 major facilitator superfamily MFS-1 [Monoraphidium neglectum]